MAENFQHYPVMLNEAVNFLNIENNPDAIYVDATLGGGGYSELILKKLNGRGKLISFDVDTDAIRASQERLKKYNNLTIVNRSYGDIKQVLSELNIDKITGGIVFDLGASYHQLTSKERGFSFNKDSKLDMRFNQNQQFCAYDVVNKYKEENLVEIFSKYGQEHCSKRIAKAIVNSRPINTTLQLAEIIKKASVEKNSRIHPATRVFQAIRIEVNQELLTFENTLKDVVTLLNYGAIISIVSFHSLEDRIAKDFFREYSKSCRCKKEEPICKCKGKVLEVLTKKPLSATEEEIKENPPSRSAKLRAARMITREQIF